MRVEGGVGATGWQGKPLRISSFSAQGHRTELAPGRSDASWGRLQTNEQGQGAAILSDQRTEAKFLSPYIGNTSFSI